MPKYENIHLAIGTPAWTISMDVKSSVKMSGEPDITLTLIKDEEYEGDKLNNSDFPKVIKIGESCYLESLDHVAFHNGRIKLTSVKVNKSPAGVIAIGNNVVLQGTSIIAYESVTIEDNVVLGPNVTIMDSSGHPLMCRGNGDEASRISSAPVLIKSHAWIGMGSIILKGVTIGSNAVVGAGSVVREDIPDYAIAYGNPAKTVSYVKHTECQ